MTWPARARQRLAALGGVAVPAAGSALPVVERFAPTPVDAQAKLAEVERLIDDLAPGLDEATGHTLDNLINAWGEAWEAEVMAEASEYDALVAGRLSALDPQAAQCRALHDLNGRRLADAKTALAAARERLVGERRPVDDSGDGERGFAPWGGKSFTEPTLLAGRGPAAFASVAVLAVAACADVAAFFQIVQLLLPRQEGEKSLLLVGGLTVVAVTLAHRAGVVLRERHAGSRTAKRWQALLCLLIWLLLVSVPLSSASTSLTPALDRWTSTRRPGPAPSPPSPTSRRAWPGSSSCSTWGPESLRRSAATPSTSPYARRTPGHRVTTGSGRNGWRSRSPSWRGWRPNAPATPAPWWRPGND